MTLNITRKKIEKVLELFNHPQTRKNRKQTGKKKRPNKSFNRKKRGKNLANSTLKKKQRGGDLSLELYGGSNIDDIKNDTNLKKELEKQDDTNTINNINDNNNAETANANSTANGSGSNELNPTGSDSNADANSTVVAETANGSGSNELNPTGSNELNPTGSDSNADANSTVVAETANGSGSNELNPTGSDDDEKKDDKTANSTVVEENYEFKKIIGKLKENKIFKEYAEKIIPLDILVDDNNKKRQIASLLKHLITKEIITIDNSKLIIKEGRSEELKKLNFSISKDILEESGSTILLLDDIEKDILNYVSKYLDLTIMFPVKESGEGKESDEGKGVSGKDKTPNKIDTNKLLKLSLASSSFTQYAILKGMLDINKNNENSVLEFIKDDNIHNLYSEFCATYFEKINE